jgi:two-component system NtrC family sensor kinase
MLRKIGFKLIAIVGLTAVIIIGIFAYVNIHSLNSRLLAEVERHANQLSETVKYSTRYDMLLNQRDRIHKVINTIGEQPSINDVRILNKSGEIIYSSKQEDIGKMVDKAAESCFACHSADKPLERLSIKERTRIFRMRPDSSRILGIINPIYNEASCWTAPCHEHSKDQTVLGVLDVTMSLEEADKQIQNSQIEMGIFAASAIVAVSFIIGFFVKRWVDGPVNVILKATQQVGSGNLNYTIQSSGKDELGMLARSFNAMTQKLSEARLQLFQSDKMASLGRLAAGVAHEINNPLTGVLTYSSFLLKRTQNNPELQDDLKVIVRETLRCREIVKSLLDFARQSVPKKNEADLKEIIDQAVAVVENQLSINHIRLIKQLEEGLPKIIVDANQIQQVFINLLVNGADAVGQSGGTISLSASCLTLLPYGVAQIKKAVCPKRHGLMDSDVKIDGLPSIRVKACSGGNEGFIYLDPIYGRHRHQYGIEIADSAEVKLMCSECRSSLLDPLKKCPKCGSPIYSIEIPSKGRLEGCTKYSCDWQEWEAIDVAGQKEYLEIKIADTGCGIPKENMAKIFEPFYTTKGQKGTGLGLSVIWGIIDNHNGTIKVDSELNKGTTFTIRLPIKQTG